MAEYTGQLGLPTVARKNRKVAPLDPNYNGPDWTPPESTETTPPGRPGTAVDVPSMNINRPDVPPDVGLGDNPNLPYDIRDKFRDIGVTQTQTTKTSGQPAWEPKKAQQDTDLMNLAWLTYGMNAIDHPQAANANTVSQTGMQLHTLEQQRLMSARPEVLGTTSETKLKQDPSGNQPNFGWYQDANNKYTGAIASNNDGTYTFRSGGYESVIERDKLKDVIAAFDPTLAYEGDFKTQISMLNDRLASTGIKVYTDRNGQIVVSQLPGDYLVNDATQARTGMQIYESLSTVAATGEAQPAGDDILAQQMAEIAAAQNAMN